MLRRVSACVLVPTFAVATWYRPLASDEKDKQRRGASSVHASSRALIDFADESEPTLLYVARSIAIFCTVSISRAYLKMTGNVDVRQDLNYHNFVNKVRNRSSDEALITVGNHRTLFDDPGVMSCLLPFWLNVKPSTMRWSLCAEEYCFNPILPDFIKGYIGAGKVLPIKRGEGINQKLFLDFARKASKGDWLHIFPEAGVWQNSELGGRENGTESTLGKLKWGVGKLIAHSLKSPVCIPFIHLGTDAMMPLEPESRKMLVYFPIPFQHDITIVFGEEIKFNDLIEEHERLHGPLRKVNADSDKDCDTIDNFHNFWDSTQEEKELYHKIAFRIEIEMTKLIRENKSYRMSAR